MLSQMSVGSITSIFPRVRRQGGDERDARSARFRPAHGQTVEVRSAGEILATLDANFGFEGLPFMPEMLKYCGRRMTVARRVNRTCVEGHGIRAMRNVVMLVDSHCDGAAHDGCQRKCLIFWKEAWLRPLDPAGDLVVTADDTQLDGFHHELSSRTREGARYLCQSTRLQHATQPLSKFNLMKYFEEIADGELRVGKFLRIIVMVLQNRLRALFGLPRIGSVHGSSGPHSKGDLDLRVGEYVKVRSAQEISRTVGPSGRNRGLLFEPDMTAYVGGIFEVDFRIERMISEETGEMVRLTNTVALKNVRCEGLCAKNCPRGQAHFWREAWIERINPTDLAPPQDFSG